MSARTARPGGHGGARRAERIYRTLLLLLPSRLRREADGELVEVFLDGWRTAPAERGRLRFWIRTVADVMTTAVAERVAKRKTRTGREGAMGNT